MCEVLYWRLDRRMAEGGLITSEGSDTSSIQDYGSARVGLRLELTDSNTLHEVPKVCLGCSYFTFSYGTVLWVGLFVTMARFKTVH